VRAIRYVEAAREEFLHEVEYFTAVSPKLGQRFDEAVQKAEVLAAEFAEMGMSFKHRYIGYQA
jgi:toxin ParE1/3/4